MISFTPNALAPNTGAPGGVIPIASPTPTPTPTSLCRWFPGLSRRRRYGLQQVPTLQGETTGPARPYRATSDDVARSTAAPVVDEWPGLIELRRIARAETLEEAIERSGSIKGLRREIRDHPRTVNRACPRDRIRGIAAAAAWNPVLATGKGSAVKADLCGLLAVLLTGEAP